MNVGTSERGFAGPELGNFPRGRKVHGYISCTADILLPHPWKISAAWPPERTPAELRPRVLRQTRPRSEQTQNAGSCTAPLRTDAERSILHHPRCEQTQNAGSCTAPLQNHRQCFPYHIKRLASGGMSFGGVCTPPLTPTMLHGIQCYMGYNATWDKMLHGIKCYMG